MSKPVQRVPRGAEVREATVGHPVCDQDASTTAGTTPFPPVPPQQVTRIIRTSLGKSQPPAAFPEICETGALDEENNEGSLAAIWPRYQNLPLVIPVLPLWPHLRVSHHDDAEGVSTTPLRQLKTGVALEVVLHTGASQVWPKSLPYHQENCPPVFVLQLVAMAWRDNTFF